MAKSFLLITIMCFAVGCGRQAKTSENIPLTMPDNSPVTNGSAEMDPVQVSPGQYKVLLENEYVRVVEYSIKPGERDNTHTHPPKTSYILSGGTLRFYPEEGETIDFSEVAGTSEWSDRVGKHHVENIGKTTVTILLTEIKSASTPVKP